MTIVSIKSGTGAELKRIELSDGSLFTFETSYLPFVLSDDDGVFLPGKELSADEEEAIRFAAVCFRVERHALRLVARAEQSCFGIRAKLEKAGYSGASVRAVIEKLSESGIVDDRRFAQSWIQSRLGRRSESPRRLLAALRSRGIDRENAEKTLKNALDSETEGKLLRGFIEKNRLKTGTEQPGPSLRSVLRYEGFSSEAIINWQDEQE
jgi:regulatory protein